MRTLQYWVDIQADLSLLVTQVLLKVLSCADSHLIRAQLFKTNDVVS